jgi:hypothetical protein
MRLLKGKRDPTQLPGVSAQSQPAARSQNAVPEAQANCFCLSNASRIAAEMALAYAR